MSRIAAGSAEGAEQGYRPYLQAALLMGLFTFLFLCAEYLYVDVLSRMVSGDRAVLALLALSGLAAGFVFDWKSRQYMGSVMYCVMMLSATDR